MAFLIDDDLRAPMVSVGVEFRARHPAELVLDGAHVQAASTGIRFGETDAGDLGIGEDDVRDGCVVGRGDMAAPRLCTHGSPRDAGGDHLTGRTGLLLALVRRWKRELFASTAEDPAVAAPEKTARQLMMLREGAMGGGYLGEPEEISETLEGGFREAIRA